VSLKPNDGSAVEYAPAAGPESIVGAGGGVASTVHVRVRGADVLSSASFARTSNVCEPSLRLVYACGEVAAFQPALSSCTSNVTPPSLSLKEKETSLPLVELPAGPESIVGTGGAVVSTPKLRVPLKLELALVSSVAFARQ
jgi:hypothetical protein